MPLAMSLARGLIARTLVLMFKYGVNLAELSCSIGIFVLILSLWLRDITRERAFQGKHSSIVQRGLKWGLIWFLFSEVWFFFSIFWAFFHIRVSPLRGGAESWPLEGLDSIPAFQVPLLNTIVLLIRGVTATLAHKEILKGKDEGWILFRSLLGVYFISLQGMEYWFRGFSICSRVVGRVFFFRTGFHGLHVILGLTILATSAIRSSLGLISRTRHFRLEFRLWYWHFVDVVWLFLFVFVYVWAST